MSLVLRQTAQTMQTDKLIAQTAQTMQTDKLTKQYRQTYRTIQTDLQTSADRLTD